MDDIFRKKIGVVFSEFAKVGDFLIEAGHFERALGVFTTLSEGDPTFEAGSYAYCIGLCYEGMNNFTIARHYFCIAAKENPHMTKYVDAANRYKKDF